MQKKNYVVLVLLLTIFSLPFTSCEKNDDPSVKSQIISVWKVHSINYRTTNGYGKLTLDHSTNLYDKNFT